MFGAQSGLGSSVSSSDQLGPMNILRGITSINGAFPVLPLTSNELHNTVNILEEKGPLTTKAEWWGWYFYDASISAFFYSAMNFLPLYITSQAEWQAKLRYCKGLGYPENICNHENTNRFWAVDYDHIGSCSSVSYNSSMSCEAVNATWTPVWNKEALFVPLFGMSTGYGVVASVSTSISVVLQLMLFILFGGVADFGPMRKVAFITSAYIATAAVMAVYFNGTSDLYWANALCMIISNAFYGLSTIFYNAYLPLLVAHDPTVDKVAEDPKATAADLVEAMMVRSNSASAVGFSVGFVGQLIFLVFNLALFSLMSTEMNLATRINVASVGIWVLITSAVTFTCIKTRPGAPLPKGSSYLSIGSKRCAATIKTSKKLKNLFKFLGAYFIFSDGCSTLAGSAAQFASIELGLGMTEILIGLLIVSVFAVIGCILFSFIGSRWKVSEFRLLQVSLVGMGLLPMYAMVALTRPVEFYVLCIFFGLFTGPQQTYTRSLFSSAVPSGHEAEFFSFYEVTDKGTAWLGPLVVTTVFNLTGSYRKALIWLVLFFVAGIFFLTFYDHDKALAEKAAFEEMESPHDINQLPADEKKTLSKVAPSPAN